MWHHADKIREKPVPEETPNAEGQPATPDAGAGGSDPAAVPAPAPAGESQPGGAASGGAGGESQPEPEATEGSGQEVPPSAGGEETPPAENAPPTTEVVGDPPTQPSPSDSSAAPAAQPSADPTTPPSSSEPPNAGLPTGDETDGEEDAATERTTEEKFVDLVDEGLEKAKEIGRATLKDALVESRDFIKTMLNNKDMSEAEKHEIARLYRAAEKHALMGKVAVAHAMGKRLDNFVKSSSKVTKSQKGRAAQNYLSGLLRLATGAVSTFFGAFGQPLVDKAADIGLTAVDEFLQ